MRDILWILPRIIVILFFQLSNCLDLYGIRENEWGKQDVGNT